MIAFSRSSAASPQGSHGARAAGWPSRRVAARSDPEQRPCGTTWPPWARSARSRAVRGISAVPSRLGGGAGVVTKELDES